MKSAVEDVKVILGKPIATSIVTVNADERRFIGEALLVGAATFILLEYCKAFLKGLGLDELGQKHGKKAEELFRNLRSGVAGSRGGNVLKELEADVKSAKGDSASRKAAQREAEREIAKVLASHGVLKSQANKMAKKISRVVADARSG